MKSYKHDGWLISFHMQYSKSSSFKAVWRTNSFLFALCCKGASPHLNAQCYYTARVWVCMWPLLETAIPAFLREGKSSWRKASQKIYTVYFFTQILLLMYNQSLWSVAAGKVQIESSFHTIVSCMNLLKTRLQRSSFQTNIDYSLSYIQIAFRLRHFMSYEYIY